MADVDRADDDATAAGPTVVVAAGDELARTVLVTVLQHQGWVAQVVETLADLLGPAGAPAVRAVVLDGRLPDATGPAAIARLRSRPATAQVPVVLLAKEEVELRAGVLAGADAVLTTPFSPLHLVEVLADLTEPLDDSLDGPHRASA